MSTITLEEPIAEPVVASNEYLQYKTLSSAAVASLVVGILSLLAFLHPWFVVIPVVGVVLALVAIRGIKANSEEFTGLPIAKAGLLLSLVFGVAGPGYQAVVYATEVPEGALRISYAQLQPDEEVPGQLIPPAALELNDQRVFIKGYIYPGQQQHGITQFVLCRDQGDCCFGGNPKVTDRIEVILPPGTEVSYSQRQFKVAGKFRVEPTQTAEGLGAVFYHLDADYIR
jgi:hypothetical protein